MKKRSAAPAALAASGLAVMLIAGLILVSGCSKQPAVKLGDTVSVQYKGVLEDGSVFDQSKEGEPLTFVLGADPMIPGFEKAVEGMKLNEEKMVTLPPEEAYGEWQETSVRKFPRSSLPEDLKPEKGMPIGMQSPTGQQMRATIVDVTDEDVSVDMNHPLAGKTLTFTIKVVEIK